MEILEVLEVPGRFLLDDLFKRYSEVPTVDIPYLTIGFTLHRENPSLVVEQRVGSETLPAA